MAAGWRGRRPPSRPEFSAVRSGRVGRHNRLRPRIRDSKEIETASRIKIPSEDLSCGHFPFGRQRRAKRQQGGDAVRITHLFHQYCGGLPGASGSQGKNREMAPEDAPLTLVR